MALDDHTAQAHLTPEERRGLLRAFADRKLLKLTHMDDPEDMPGVERAVRVTAVIERVYSRCDRDERQMRDQIRDKTPDPHKAEAERATHEEAAIKARVSLANTLKWGEERRQGLGQWWDEAQHLAKTPAQEPVPAQSHPQKPAAPERQSEAVLKSPPSWQKVTYVDLTDDIEAARAELALKRREAAKSTPIPHASPHGPPHGPPYQRPPLNSG